MREIIQPNNLKVPKENDPMLWARVERIGSEWIRIVAPQLGLDPQKLITAQVLNNISGDDINAFSYVFFPEKAKIIKKRIFERMNWELSLPETPENIKMQIKKTMPKLEKLDFSHEAEWIKARKTWIRSVRNYTNKQIEENKSLREAIKYRDENWRTKLVPYWNEFMYGNKFEDLYKD